MTTMGCLPEPVGWHRWDGDGTGGDQLGPAWEEQPPSYARSKEVYRCPAYPREVQFCYFLNMRFQYRNYGCTFADLEYLSAPAAYALLADCSEKRSSLARWARPRSPGTRAIRTT